MRRIIDQLANRAINIRLVQNVLDLNLLPDKQVGFCSEHSTTEQIVKVTKYFSAGLETLKRLVQPFVLMSQKFLTQFGTKTLSTNSYNLKLLLV